MLHESTDYHQQFLKIEIEIIKLVLFNATLANYQPYHDENMLHLMR
jgi:hypothetical protein